MICDKQVHGHLTGFSMSKKSSKYYNVQKYNELWIVDYIHNDECIRETFFNENDAAIAADYHNILRFKDFALRNFPEFSKEEISQMYKKVKIHKKEHIKNKISAGNQGKLKKKVTEGGSKYVGVYRNKYRTKWYAEITKDRKKYRLGEYVDEIEAARAYDKKARELYGDNAVINIKEEKI